MKIALLTKRDRFSRAAQSYAAAAFDDLHVAEGAIGDPRPSLLEREHDLLISFLSPWIITETELSRAKVAINFHPASTDYPGSGCYNFALYEGSADYGAVCHHMLAAVDTGAVIMEVRFEIGAHDTVELLKKKTMEIMVLMFHSIVDGIKRGTPLPTASAHWSRRPFTRRQLEQLRRCETGMPPEEIQRRVRATTYPGHPGAYLVDGADLKHFPVPDRPAVA